MIKFNLIYKRFIKNVLAKVLSAVLLIIFFPLFLGISVLIKIDSKGSCFFIQERMGKLGKPFKIYKFRTMYVHDKDIGIQLTTYKNDPRITKIGRILRKTSLDELPQLINIIKGDMCFIGPRPLVDGGLLHYNEYTGRNAERFTVLPGMFCLVDTLYRAEATIEIQCELDAQYVDNINFVNDVKILFRTLLMVIRCKNVYTDENLINEENKELAIFNDKDDT